MIKKAWPFVCLLLIFAMLLSSCSPASVEASPPLRVEYTIWEGDYTLLIAQEKGFFAKYGVEVEPVFYEVFSEVIPDFGAKKVDGGLLAIGDLLATANIVPVRAVAALDSGGTLSVMARPEIDSVAALQGKSVGVLVDTYGELVVRLMLKSAGLTARDVTLVNVDPELVPEKLASGEIAAGFVWDPWDRIAIEAGNKVLFAQTSDVPLFPDVIVFSDEVIQKRPDDVRAFLKAWFEALAYRQANPVECQEIIARITNQTVEDVAPTNKIILYDHADNLRLFDTNTPPEESIYEMAKVNLQFMIDQGTISISPKIENILDPTFLK